MHQRRFDRSRPITTPRPIPELKDDVPPPQERFQSFRLAADNLIGRELEEQEIWPQKARSDSPSESFEIIPFRVMLPRREDGQSEFARLRAELIVGITQCESLKDLKKLRALFDACRCSYDAQYARVLVQRSIDFGSFETVFSIVQEVEARGLSLGSEVWQDFLAQSVDRRLPLIASICAAEVSGSLPSTQLQYIMSSLATMLFVGSPVSEAVKALVLRRQHELAQCSIELTQNIISNLTPEAFDDEFLCFLDGFIASNPVESFVSTILEKLLNNVRLSCSIRIKKAIEILRFTNEKVFQSRKIVNDFVKVIAACESPSLQLQGFALLFRAKVLSNVQLLRFLEVVASIDDKYVRLLQECLTITKKVDRSEFLRTTNHSALRCVLFHNIMKIFIQCSQGHSMSRCLEAAVKNVHGSLSQKLTQTSDGDWRVAIFPLESMRTVRSALTSSVAELDLCPLLSCVFQGISNRLMVESKTIDDAADVLNFLNLENNFTGTFDRFADTILENQIYQTAALKPQLKPLPGDLEAVTLLVVDVSALRSLKNLETREKFAQFMTANSTKQSMHVVVPFPALLRLVHQGDPLNMGEMFPDDSHTLPTVMQMLCQWSEKYDWLSLLSSSVTFDSVRSVGWQIQLPVGTNKFDFARVLTPTFVSHVNSRCRRAIIIVHSLWTEFVYTEVFRLKPVLQLPALLARG